VIDMIMWTGQVLGSSKSLALSDRDKSCDGVTTFGKGCGSDTGGMVEGWWRDGQYSTTKMRDVLTLA